jgi:hypothetical protein
MDQRVMEHYQPLIAKMHDDVVENNITIEKFKPPM